MASDKPKLTTMLGNYPDTAALKKGELKPNLFDFDFAEVKVANQQFKSIVRDAKYDIGELAIQAPDATAKMRHWMERGLTGMRLFTFGSTMSEQAAFDDPKSFPAWTYAADRGLSICMQMSASGIPQLVKMIERFPNVKVLLDHMARPTLDDGPPYAAAASLFGLARYPSVYLKLTKRNFEQAGSGKATPETFFPKLVAEFGAQRLSWGSNYPSSEGTMPDILKVAQRALAVLPQQDQDWIFAKTAQVLYPALKD